MKLHSVSNNKHREIKDIQDIIQLMSVCDINPENEDIVALFKKI